MKLYEFVEKIEGMGEVEKKAETLNESADTYTSFWGDFWDGPSKTLNESLNEDMNDDFIKIYKTSDSIPNDAWDFPIEELDYLLEEHPGESFALLNNRLYEIKDEYKVDESLDASGSEFGDYRDEFYSLIDGMDPVDVVDMMVSHMNEYEMDDLIKSLRGAVCAPDDMEEE